MTVMRRTPRRSRCGEPSRQSGLGTILLVLLTSCIFLAVAASSFLYYVLLKELPSVAALKDYRPSIATRVYDDRNELIDEFFLEDRMISPHAKIEEEEMQMLVTGGSV